MCWFQLSDICGNLSQGLLELNVIVSQRSLVVWSRVYIAMSLTHG